jgi:hypothetical protein
VYRTLKLLIAVAAIASAPLPALAQAWSTTVVASAPRMSSPTRVPALNLERETTLAYPVDAQPIRQEHRILKLDPSADRGDIPDVEVPAKAEWSDDQGLRVGPTKLGYKSRF